MIVLSVVVVLGVAACAAGLLAGGLGALLWLAFGLRGED
jgi:hypothetical protein